jgi:DNA replication initiation complex subunit (GINS family)
MSKLTDEEKKYIIDVIRIIEGLKRKLKELLDKPHAVS